MASFIETSCGRRVIRKSTTNSTTMAPMVMAHSRGVPIDGCIAAGSAAASTDKGDMELLKTEPTVLRSPSPPGCRVAPHRVRRGADVLTGTSLGSTPLVVTSLGNAAVFTQVQVWKSGTFDTASGAAVGAPTASGAGCRRLGAGRFTIAGEPKWCEGEASRTGRESWGVSAWWRRAATAPRAARPRGRRGAAGNRGRSRRRHPTAGAPRGRPGAPARAPSAVRRHRRGRT